MTKFSLSCSLRDHSLPYFSRIAGRRTREGRKSRCSPPTAMVKKNLAQVPIMWGKILHEKCHLTMRNVKMHCKTIPLPPLVVTLTAVAGVSHTDGFSRSTSRYPFSSVKYQFFVNLFRLFSSCENNVYLCLWYHVH